MILREDMSLQEAIDAIAEYILELNKINVDLALKFGAVEILLRIIKREME